MYCCKACGGRNVEALNWVDLNTGEVEDEEGTAEEYYCRDCNAPTDVEYRSSFDEDLSEDINVLPTSKSKNEFKE